MESLLDDAGALGEVAAHVADGIACDWDAAESSAPDDTVRARIRLMREVAAIGRVYALQSLDTLLEGSRSSQDSPYSRFDRLPAVWGSLHVLAEIGRGRFGTVYRAWDPALDREVALKLLDADRLPSSSDTAAPDEALVVHEGRLMARVRHSNVATIFGAQRIDGRTGIWMELVQGQTLEATLRADGPLEAGEITKVGVELCRALQAVHEAGLVHRDVKAQNVIREPGGRIVLGDFGTGRELRAIERPPAIAGTPVYLAPEIFERTPPTPQSDLYSLGVLLFHLATGRYPVSGRSFGEIREAHSAGQRDSLLALRPNLSPQLADAIQRALEHDPARRFASARDMEAALDAGLKPVHNGDAALSPERSLGRILAWPRVAGTLVVIAAFGLALVASRYPATSTSSSVSAPRAPLAPTLPTLDQSVPTRTGDPATPVAILSERDAVLVVGIENRTGETALDDALTYALEFDLRDSPYVRVASRDRVEDALFALNTPASTRLNRQLARDVAVRDGELRAMVIGRVEKNADGYVLLSEIVSPQDGVTRWTTTSRASNHSQLLRVVRDQAFALRLAFGEPAQSVEGRRRILRPSLTPSPRALRMLVEIEADLNVAATPPERNLGVRYAAAEPLLREAVSDDPDLLPALVRLAWTLRTLERPAEEYLPLARRARQLAGPSPHSAEEYFATASALQMEDEIPESQKVVSPERLSQAARAYEAALRREPQLWWAVRPLWAGLSDKAPDAVNLQTAAADARPLSYELNASAAWALLRSGNLAQARRYARRAAKATYPLDSPRTPVFLGSVRVFDAWVAWANGDVQTAARLADAFPLETLGQRERISVEVQLWHLYGALGQLRRAERHVLSPYWRRQLLTLRGDSAGLRDLMATEAFQPRPNTINTDRVLLLAHLGLLDEADSERLNFPAVLRNLAPGNLALIADGAVALARRQYVEAVSLLEKAWTLTRTVPSLGNNEYWPDLCEQLATALAAAGDFKRANAVLLEGIRLRAPALQYTGPPPARSSPRLQELRVQVLRQADRESESRYAELMLERSLAVADQDHPVLVRLRADRAARFGRPQPPAPESASTR